MDTKWTCTVHEFAIVCDLWPQKNEYHVKVSGVNQYLCHRFYLMIYIIFSSIGSILILVSLSFWFAILHIKYIYFRSQFIFAPKQNGFATLICSNLSNKNLSHFIFPTQFLCPFISVSCARVHLCMHNFILNKRNTVMESSILFLSFFLQLYFWLLELSMLLSPLC